MPIQSTVMSEGVMPAIRPAWPSVLGPMSLNFSRASAEEIATLLAYVDGPLRAAGPNARRWHAEVDRVIYMLATYDSANESAILAALSDLSAVIESQE